MEQNMRVRRILPSGAAEVMYIRESACSGDCHKCSGCGAAKETMIVEARNAINARPGDLVVVSSDTRGVMTAIFVVYLLPLLLFFGGYALGYSLGVSGGLVGCIGFVLGLGCAVLLDRSRQKNHNETVYTITGYVRQEGMHDHG